MEAKLGPYGKCTEEGCLVGQTNKCALSKPLLECEFYEAPDPADTSTEENAEQEKKGLSAQTDVALEKKREAKLFHSGRELGKNDSLPISHSRYTKLFALFGKSEAGKTTFLLSLYLQALHGLLPNDYLFAGCQTLKAFEQRLQLIRDWSGDTENLFPVLHTRFNDPRQPALLHLALKTTEARHDLLFTDYPGEWTEKMGDKTSFAERLTFLKHAHGVMLVLNGVQFSNNEERHAEAESSRMVLDRLVTDIKVCAKETPVAILIAKSDMIQMTVPESAKQVAQHATDLGFPTKLISLASFSQNTELAKHGTGVFDTIEYLLTYAFPRAPIETQSIVDSDRSLHRFRA